MVSINNREFDVYNLDTIESFVMRIASHMKTLPQYIYFTDGLPTMETVREKEANIEVVDILDEIRKNAPNIKFSEFVAKNGDRLNDMDMLNDVLKPYLALNTELASVNKEYIDTILFDIAENAKSTGKFDESLNIDEIWRDRKSIISSLKNKIEQNRDESKEKLKEFSRFQKIDETQISHTEFIVEKVVFQFNIDGFENINMSEIFNDIVLTKNIPFASFGIFFKILREKVPFSSWAELHENAIMLRLCQSKVSQTELDDYTIAFMKVIEDKVNVVSQLTVNKNNVNETTAVSEIIDAFATKKLRASDVKQNFISGVFYIANQSMDNYVFSDLVMNNKLFSNFLVINENMKASKKKLGLYVHFNLLSVGRVTANITGKIVTRSDYYQIGMSRAMFPIGSNYIRVKITRTDNINTAHKFMSVLCKLFAIYNEEYDSIIKIYRAFIPSFATEEIKRPRETKLREKNLRDIAPDIFHANYSRKCIHKPIVVSEEDLSLYKDKHVLKFPKDDKIAEQRYYVCDHDKHKYVGLRENPFENKDKFPYVPCCYIKNQENISGSELRHYYYGEELQVRNAKQQHLFVTDKFVFENMFGKLPRNLDLLFNMFDENSDYMYLRRGVERGKNSFLQCVISVFNLTESRNANFILKIRKRMATKEFASSCRQEMYDKTIDDILTEMNDENAYMSPRKYIHGFEAYFKCDIFLFTRDSAGGELAIPDHLQAYYKYKTNRRCIFIFEHMGSESDNAKYPQCEVICRWNKNDETDITYIFEENDAIAKKVRNTFDFMNEYYLLDKQIYDILIKTEFDVVSQVIDSYGKTRMLYVKYGDEIISIMTPPLPPLYVREIEKSVMIKANSERVFDFIDKFGLTLVGRNEQNGVNGLVCLFGNIEVFVSIEYTDILNKIKNVSSNLLCVESDQSVLRHHMVAKKYARYSVEYMFWLFSKFLNDNGIDSNDKAMKSIEKFVEKNIVINSDFEFDNVSKFFAIDSGILHGKKLVVTSDEVLKRLAYVLRLKIVRNFSELVEYNKRKMIESYYMNAFDFTRHWQQIVLEGTQSVLEWIENRETKYVLYDDVQQSATLPYFFRNKRVGEEIFLAKNATTIENAIKISVFWRKNRYMLVENIDEIFEYEFSLILYNDKNDIETYLVRGEKSAYDIRILCYRKENGENEFVSLMHIN